MDIKALKTLKNTNYFHVVATLLGGFQKITRKNYEKTLDDQSYDVLIKEETPQQALLNFKHDEVNYCDASLDFAVDGELVNVRVLILAVGFMKRWRTKQHLARLRQLLKKIAKNQNSHLETLRRRRQYRLVSNGLMVTLNYSKNEHGQPYVSIWCEYLPA